MLQAVAHRRAAFVGCFWSVSLRKAGNKLLLFARVIVCVRVASQNGEA